MPKSDSEEGEDTQELRDIASRPQGAPRGLLIYYVLHSIAQKPSHGYEILQDIESKTEGAWRPGAGSIYPLLKKLESHRLIEPVEAPKGGTAQQVYSITPIGIRYMEKISEHFKDIGKKWSSMRHIFIEIMGTENIADFLIGGANAQFSLTRELFDSKMDKMPKKEVESILKEYSLLLERQLEWSGKKLEEIKNSSNADESQRGHLESGR